MPISPYVKLLREKLGSRLLLLPSVMGVIYDAQSRVLLVRQSADALWSTPGGVIELDETPATAVVRELREETGLDTTVVRLLGVCGGPAFVVDYPNGDRTQYISSVFECAVTSGTLTPDGDETDALMFVGPEELATLQCQPWLYPVIPLLWQRSPTPFYQ